MFGRTPLFSKTIMKTCLIGGKLDCVLDVVIGDTVTLAPAARFTSVLVVF